MEKTRNYIETNRDRFIEELFGLEADAIHSPNENYPLENLFAGMQAIPLYFRYYTEMKGSV